METHGHTAERWTALRGLIEQAMQLPPEERLEYIRCHTSDEDLRRETEQLLSFEKDASSLFSVTGWRNRSESSWTSTSLEPDTRVGQFRVLHEIGRGGMGAVYLAERADGTYDQQVAIKLLQESHHSKELERRFLMERQILANLSHPGVVRLLDGGLTERGQPYLAMEYVPGRHIDRYCDEEQLDLPARLRLFLRVADVVQAAHQQLVLHLDLKPANILIDAKGQPRLLDFGIARLLAEDGGGFTQPSLLLMTPRYASPEQAEGKPLGVASDVFSLTTLIYRILTGTLPYPLDESSPLEAARMIREMAPRTPSKIAPALKGDIDAILLKGLRKEPEHRYPTIAALMDDVERHLESRPVMAHQGSVSYRAGKFLQRHRFAIAATAAMVAVLAVSMGAIVRSERRAQHERDVAERRLLDVRSLAHSYIFDLDKMLIDLPGTLNIRHLVLTNATKYLESMSRESGNDEELQRELIEGYLQIGRVQANPGMPSMTNWKAAEASLEKAAGMQRELVRRHPDRLADRALMARQLIFLSQVYEFENNLARREALAQEAWELTQPVIAAGPRTERYLQSVSAALMMVRLHGGSGDDWTLANPNGAEEWIRRTEEALHPYEEAQFEGKDIDLMRHHEQLLLWAKANLARQQNDIPGMGRYYQAALAVPTTDGNGQSEDLRHFVIRLCYGKDLLALGRTAEARSVLTSITAKNVHEKLKEDDRSALSGEADTQMLIGQLQLQEGNLADGKRNVTEALASMEHDFAQNPGDSTVSAQVAMTSLRLGDSTALTATERRQHYERSIEIASGVVKKQPAALTASLVLARAELGLASIAGDGQGRRSHLKAARQHIHAIFAARPSHPEATALLDRAGKLDDI
jgi:serine/threonine protein kinase/tetratricopeptide (TPR) repeat protein